MNHMGFGRILVVGFLAMPVSLLASWQIDPSKSPLEFLGELCEMRFGVYFVDEPVRGWVQERDVAQLINLVDSRQPCSSVALSGSSTLNWRSNRGDEAAFPIRGFFTGSYPPSPASETLSDCERAMLVRFWTQREEQRLTNPDKSPAAGVVNGNDQAQVQPTENDETSDAKHRGDGSRRAQRYESAVKCSGIYSASWWALNLDPENGARDSSSPGCLSIWADHSWLRSGPSLLTAAGGGINAHVLRSARSLLTCSFPAP